ncbi:MAG: hypothetical protein IPJ22_04685 [Bacteroidetes bacterium]|nr:hypothetical protein [Bacteroidota bacterium]
MKYLSRAATLQKIENLTKITSELSVFETVKKCVKEILNFTYEDIVKKRKDAVNDLFKFISESLDRSKQKQKEKRTNLHLKIIGIIIISRMKCITILMQNMLEKASQSEEAIFPNR